MTRKTTLGILLLIVAGYLSGFGQDQLFINEFLASNSITNVDSDFSAFSDWIEIYNNEESDVDLSGYFLTDDIATPEKWQIPTGTIISSKGYLIFWADKEDMVDLALHTNFKLKANGEEIGLFNKAGELVDLKAFDGQATDVSYGRQPDGISEWMYFSQPTPGAYNGTTAYPSLTFSSNPEFSHQRGVYNSPLQLVLSTQPANKTIRFTLDGSAPNENSSEYSNPIQINATTVIRARVFETGKLPGNTITHSFIVDNDVELPVFSIATHPDFLWSEEMGIYVYEDLERRKDWERPVHIDFFDTPNNSGFNIDADIRLFGNTAYLLPQKSLSVFPKNTLNYQMFSDKDIATFESFILRSSSDDWNNTMFCDAMIQTLIPGHLIIDYQAYRPSIVFLNGQYFGIHNIREKYNKNYLASNHGVDPDNIDLLALSGYSGAYYVHEGDAEHYNAMMDFIVNNDMALDENFEYVKTQMEVDDFIDWCIIENYIKNQSWKHNIKIWRPKTDDGKWKWLLFDTDRGYETPDDTLIDDFYQYETRFNNLYNNTDFKNEFLQRYSSHINITFGTERVTGIIDSIKTVIEAEMPNHILRWADSGGVQSMDYWDGQVNVMKNFANLRKGFVREYVDSFFGLNGTAKLTVNINEFSYGTVSTHGIKFPYSDSAWVYFKDIPIRIEAIANPGYEFIGWEGLSAENEIFVTLTDDFEITAVFEPQCDFSTTVTDDQYLLAVCSPYIIDQNIIVEAGATLFAEPGVEILMADSLGIYVYGRMEFTGSQENPIIISPQEGAIHWKGISGEDAEIFLDYVEISEAYKAIRVNNCETQLTNSTFYESSLAASDMINAYGGMVTIDGCGLYGLAGSGANNRDCIDCDGIVFGQITNNHIYDIVDDGIDIGTESLNITIENNYIENCQSMGISVGESSIAEIKRNIVVNCEGGIQVHTGATGYIINNTLYNNLVSLKCLHYDHQLTSGGNAFVTNTIFSNSIDEVYKLVENSILEISWSISDTDSLPGEDNLFGAPGFVNPLDKNFDLLYSSPCIDSGDPAAPADPDGTRADIGALFYDQQNNIPIPDDEPVLIFPNPASNIITVEFEKSTIIIKLEVFNIIGKKVMSFDNINSNHKTITCDNLTKGLYVFYIKTFDGNSFKRKFVIL